jgi:hypothetical protein
MSLFLPIYAAAKNAARGLDRVIVIALLGFTTLFGAGPHGLDARLRNLLNRRCPDGRRIRPHARWRADGEKRR